ncbi:lytic transglycosylase domain-containing protein [Streptomyces sp. NPDC047928]|uniref:lytic transglycosylase domain-containing protein n=1 Tax=unclassified Streptomyces TaxID=2593676 RepID=UPI003720D949
MAALTGSQAPGALERAAQPGRDGAVSPGHEAPGDAYYYTALPPLGPRGAPDAGPGRSPADGVVATPGGGGIPATVLAAYRRAEERQRESDPGCGLRWQLLAAIGQVESGQARGGQVDAHGTTYRPIIGPRLDGAGFALIRDTDGGAHDGDTVFDRAVGPMQFIPSTWALWGADGNDDGLADPHNVHDAALAAGRYLCAGGRDLSDPADLDRAVLAYNRSREYLRTVRAWYAYFGGGRWSVLPDGRGPVPGREPGTGTSTGPTAPASRPTPRATGSPSPAPSPSSSGTGSGSPSGAPSPTPTRTADRPGGGSGSAVPPLVTEVSTGMPLPEDGLLPGVGGTHR